MVAPFLNLFAHLDRLRVPAALAAGCTIHFNHHHREVFDIVVCFEEKVMEQVVEGIFVVVEGPTLLDCYKL